MRNYRAKCIGGKAKLFERPPPYGQRLNINIDASESEHTVTSGSAIIAIGSVECVSRAASRPPS